MSKLVRAEIRVVLQKFSKEELQRGWLDRDERICRVLQHIGELDHYPRDVKRVKPHVLVWNGWELVKDHYD